MYRMIAVPTRLPAQGFACLRCPPGAERGPSAPAAARLGGTQNGSNQGGADGGMAPCPSAKVWEGKWKETWSPLTVSVSCLLSWVTVTAQEQPWNTTVWPATRVWLSFSLAWGGSPLSTFAHGIGRWRQEQGHALCGASGLPLPAGGRRQGVAGPWVGRGRPGGSGAAASRSPGPGACAPAVPVPAPVPSRRPREPAGRLHGLGEGPGTAVALWRGHRKDTGTSGRPTGGNPGKHKH